MDPLLKTPRKRVANFTADEKALLAQLIKKRPIIESKLTDGKSVIKKKAAWETITEEFNCQAHVHKRNTDTLKRAWDNMKAVTRKARATERGNLIRTGGGPPDPPQPPQQGALVAMVEEAAPVIVCEIENSFDSDGTILNKLVPLSKEQISPSESNHSVQCQDYSTEKQGSQDLKDKVIFTVSELGVCSPCTPLTQQSSTQQRTAHLFETEKIQTRKPTDLIRREAVMRLKNLEAKKKIEFQILKVQLETAETKKRTAAKEEEIAEANKRAAAMEEERSYIRLEMAKMELAKLKNTIAK